MAAEKISMEEVLLEATGINGKLLLFKNIVRIHRFGVMSFLHGASRVEKDIVISQIRSIHFRKAGLLSNGFMDIDVMQGSDRSDTESGPRTGDCIVTFRPGQQRAFEAFRGVLEERMAAGPVKAPTAATSTLDELGKLASLRDRRIITEEEFNRKKSQILGL